MLQQILHRHADARLIVFLRGEYRERSFRESGRFRAGDFLIRPAYYAHDGIGDDTVHYVALPLSRNAVSAHLARHGWKARRGQVSEALLRAVRNGDCSGDELIKERPTLSLAEDEDESALSRIASALWQTNPGTLRALARSERLLPWTLTRAFKRNYGVAPSQYRKEAMAQHALSLIAETDMNIAAIAAISGFADQSHLCRTLRAITGATPTSLRRSLT
ncbi:AraC family transcriptional regulator [Marinicauda algicola]|uniref:AraC family transcriptional regulator n=1 Tax=Marinicauda algicola TaxID=2029849 RepID=A0A4V3RY10_9PROT|nr:helix-turn-helix transcriptional regulator [Marinicauda algicola]TGY88609.1 AraC family transcriptional regulator [Marinicauda algicola]